MTEFLYTKVADLSLRCIIKYMHSNRHILGYFESQRFDCSVFNLEDLVYAYMHCKRIFHVYVFRYKHE
jgi:hypothetical protein